MHEMCYRRIIVVLILEAVVLIPHAVDMLMHTVGLRWGYTVNVMD
jgi:hypothetical protein